MVTKFENVGNEVNPKFKAKKEKWFPSFTLKNGKVFESDVDKDNCTVFLYTDNETFAKRLIDICDAKKRKEIRCRLQQLLSPHCNECVHKDGKGRVKCQNRHAHDPAQCIVIGHAHGSAKTITVGPLVGKDKQGVDRMGVEHRAPSCPGTSGGMVVPLAWTEEAAGDGRLWPHLYCHKGRRGVTSTLHMTTDAWLD